MDYVSKEKPGSRYTMGEELVNSISHGLGSILSVSGTTLMVLASALQRDWFKLAASIIFGVSLMLLYLMSTLYHAIRSPKVKEVLRVFDHCSIFILIAGTYTPYTMVTLREGAGWPLFGGIWAAAVLGIILNIVSIERFKHFSMICYLGMGWSVVAAIKPMMEALPAPGFWLLVGGGLAYTVGVVFYLLKKVRYFHGIWHFFVLAGSVLHFFSIFLYIIV